MPSVLDLASSPVRVLIVDDDPADAHLASLALRQCKTAYVHKCVTSMQECIGELASNSFDIVLLDLGMESSEGIETLRSLRLQDERIPVVVFSGLENEDVAIAALENGAQDYLYKNELNPRFLDRTMRYAIQRQASVLENRRLLATVRENEDLLQRKNGRLKKLYETAHAFVDNVSHEFRTPLTVVKEYVSLVRDGTLGPIGEEQVKFLRIAEDRADDLNTMVDDMLDVSKLEAGLLHIRRDSHTVSEIFGRVSPFLRRKADVKELDLEIEFEGALPTVFCDSEKIERVIINLAVNAMKFTSERGKVRIWAKQRGKEIVMGVTDSGPGIASECLTSIFERFKQVDHELKSSTKGFGLGLNIANELVSINLGEMQVESEVGVGSTFSFSVPLDNRIEVVQRYVQFLLAKNVAKASLVVASADASRGECTDVNNFAMHLVRGNDLSFRIQENMWIFVLPEPKSECERFIARAQQELEAVNRNRPLGALPKVTFILDDSWDDLQINSDELVARVRTYISSRGVTPRVPDSSRMIAEVQV